MASLLLAVPGGDYKSTGPLRTDRIFQDVQTFIDDQQGQIIITVVVEGVKGQHLRSKCQLTFHSQAFRGRERGLKTAGPG